MISRAIEQIKSLSDRQLEDAIESVRNGDLTPLRALEINSATVLANELIQRKLARPNMTPRVPDSKTVIDKLLEQAGLSKGIGGLDIPGALEEDSFASGGIVSFNKGGGTADFQLLETATDYDNAPAPSPSRELSAEEVAKLPPRQYAAYREARLKDAIARERAALGPAPQEYSDEEQQEIQKKQLEFLRGISEPSLRRMQEILDKQRPDESRTKGELERAAINRGFASMIGAPRRTRSRLGSFAQNVGAAVQGGMGLYETGIAKIEQAKKDYAKSEMEFLKAKLADEAGDAKAANAYMANAVKDRQNAVRTYRGGISDLQRREASERLGISQELRADMAADTARKERERREAQLEAEIKAGKYERRGGDGGAARSQEVTIRSIVAALRKKTDLMDDLESKFGGDAVAIERALRAIAMQSLGKEGSAPATAPTPPGGYSLGPDAKLRPKAEK